jgi:OOP family OmpA-OmpF porin
MKRMILGVAVAVFVCVGVVSVASADVCEFYQWKPNYCAERAPAPAPAPRRVERLVLQGIYFDTGSARIKEQSYGVLNNNARQLRARKNVDITVVGYTDSQGGERYNQNLSENRARSVKQYLVSQGVSSARINSVGRGESNPVDTNATAAGRSRNRRIEIEIERQ